MSCRSSFHSRRMSETKLVREKLASSLPGKTACRTVKELCAATRVVEAMDSPMRMGVSVRASRADMAVDTTLLAAIGPRTAKDARKAGLQVSVVADKQTVDALIESVSHFTLPHAADEFAP